MKTAFHPDLSPADISPASELTLIERHAARGIVVRGETILLQYTKSITRRSTSGNKLARETSSNNLRLFRPVNAALGIDARGGVHIG